MSIINQDTIKNISKGENVFVSADNEVRQLKIDLPDWNAATSLTEGSVTEVGETYRVTNGDHVAVLEVAAAVSGSLNSTTQFATSNNLLKTQLGKLDPVSSNSGVAVLDGVVYKRKFEGKVGTDNFALTTNPAGIHVNDDHNTSTSSALGYGASNNVTILHATNTVRFEKYFGPANTSSLIPAGTVFYISSSEALKFDDFGDAGTTKPKAGFYVNTSSSGLQLAANIFKNNLNTGSDLQAVGDTDTASSADQKAAVEVIDDISQLPEENGITNITGPLEDLAQPSATNDFWEKKPALTEPLGAGGSVQLGAFWVDESAVFSDTAQVKYWDVISEGLVKDLAASNTNMWQEFDVVESTDSLIYRS